MLVRQNQSFNVSAFSGSVSKPFNHRLAANMLVSAYEGVLREPLPERLEKLVRELERRDRSLTSEQR